MLHNPRRLSRSKNLHYTNLLSCGSRKPSDKRKWPGIGEFLLRSEDMANVTEELVTSWLASIQFMQRFQKLFITGCPKSGTTWLVRALDGHPQVVANGEGRFAWRLFPFLEQALNAFNKDHHAFAGTKHAQIHEAEALLVMRSFSDNLLLRYLMTSGKAHERVRVV